MRKSLLFYQRKFRLADIHNALSDRTLTDQLMSDAEFSHDVAEAIYRLKLLEIRPPGKLLDLFANHAISASLTLDRPRIRHLLLR